MVTPTDKRIAKLAADGMKWCCAAESQVSFIETKIEKTLRSGKPNMSRVAASALRSLGIRAGYEAMDALVRGDEHGWEECARSRDLWWPNLRMSGGTADVVTLAFAHLWVSGDEVRSQYLANKLAQGLVRPREQPRAPGDVAWELSPFAHFALSCWSLTKAVPRPVPATDRDLGLYAPFILKPGEGDMVAQVKTICDYHLKSALSDSGADFHGAPYQLLAVDLMLLRRLCAFRGGVLPEVDHPLIASGFGKEVDWSAIRVPPHRLLAAIEEKAHREGLLPPDEHF